MLKVRWFLVPKLQEAKNRFSITIPRTLVERKGWKKGQELLLMFNEKGNVEIIQ